LDAIPALDPRVMAELGSALERAKHISPLRVYYES
jgi:hypothetical protein